MSIHYWINVDCLKKQCQKLIKSCIRNDVSPFSTPVSITLNITFQYIVYSLLLIQSK